MCARVRVCLLLHILLLALYTLHVDSTVLQRKKQVGGTGRQAFSMALLARSRGALDHENNAFLGR